MTTHNLATNLGKRFRRPEPRLRVYRRIGGMTLIEVLVSALLLMTVMSFVTSLCFRINMLWKDVGHHRIAMAELSNQLEEVTRLSIEDAETQITKLQASEYCSRTLLNPKLIGRLVSDELGTRVILQLDWKRKYPGKPLELAGWLSPNLPLELNPGDRLENVK